jgi:sec-independent protein translocase protein TatB
MLLDWGWSEILLIGIVALVVIGPKDLPRAMKVAGFWIRKAREMSREFQSSVDQMIREAELDEVRQDFNKIGEFDLEHEFHKTVDADGSLAEGLKPPELEFSAPAAHEATAEEPAEMVHRIEAPAAERPAGAPAGIVQFEP